MSSIIVAVDVSTEQEALSLADALDPKKCRLKVGKELYTAIGPRIVEKFHAKNFDVFLDLKFHDIPNTTAQAVKTAAELGVWMVNVHALGGLQMMCAARDILAQYNQPPLLIAVTLLTSMNEAVAHEIGLSGNMDCMIKRLTDLVFDAGLDGVVCSANEASMIANAYGEQLLTVCPGIRIGTTIDKDDQLRIMTPEEAIAKGARYLVIGRPITQANDPAVILDEIFNRIQEQ